MQCSLHNVSKRFGRDWILKDVKLSFDSGDKLAILGSNGSGKSTLLRIVAGQLSPSTGVLNYELQGKSLSIDHLYKHVSLVAPYVDVYRQFTFRELVRFHFSLRKKRDKITDEIIFDSIEVPKDKPLSSFSSGMLQRVKLALAFSTDSSLILLDEPTMNLDEEGTDWFNESLSSLPPETSILLASNEPARETKSCNLVYRLEKKQLIRIADRNG